MDTRGCLFLCLFVCAGVGWAVGEELIGSICRPNERFLSCGGCQKTCKDPAPVCQSVCRTGCFCNEGEVRNETGHCVKLADCPPVEMSSLHTSEPRHTDSQCPPDEEYRSCEPCNRTCEYPNPICPAQCARGCFCRDGLLRDKDGRCVIAENCSNVRKSEKSNFIKPIAYELTCGPHQVYACRTCERTCSSPKPECHVPCSTGCFCDEGFLKAPSGKCVKLEDCPKAEVSLGGAQEPTIEDCSSDEIYLACGWCEPSCWEPKPECPRGVCTRGCLCRPPLLRHHSGHCVAEQDCTPRMYPVEKCPDPNEEFVCRYGCEARCDTQKCISRPRHCVLGCHCRLGLLRETNGKCVTQEMCLNYQPSLFNNTHDKILTAEGMNNTPYSSEDTNSSFRIISDSYPIVLASNSPKSVFDVEDPKIRPKYNNRPFTDAISRAVKFYKEFIHNPVPQNTKNVYIPRTIKDLTSPRFYRDENVVLYQDMFNAKDLVDSDNNPIFAEIDAKPPKDGKAKNYMNDFISVMKEMMPQPMNFTIINYPW